MVSRDVGFGDTDRETWIASGRTVDGSQATFETNLQCVVVAHLNPVLLGAAGVNDVSRQRDSAEYIVDDVPILLAYELE